MLKINVLQKVVLVLAVLALLAGVFAFNFILPGHGIEIATGRNGNNNIALHFDKSFAALNAHEVASNLVTPPLILSGQEMAYVIALPRMP